MSIKEVKKKKEFLKIAQGLGIAIPASILFATNVDASPVNTVFNNSKVLVEKSIKVNKENAVVEHIMLKLKMSEDGNLLAHMNSHSDVPANHTNNHSNRPHSDRPVSYTTNVTDPKTGAEQCKHTNYHSNSAHGNAHSDRGKAHTNNHVNRNDC